MEKLLPISKDVFYSPIFMKKNRPAYKLTVLCQKEKEEEILDIIFKHTTSIGIRKYPVDRIILERKIITIDTKYGKSQAKIVKYKDEKYCYPEYEDVKTLSEKTNAPIQEIYTEIINQYNKENKKDYLK